MLRVRPSRSGRRVAHTGRGDARYVLEGTYLGFVVLILGAVLTALLEGGYDPTRVGQGAVAVIRAPAGLEVP